MNWFTFCDQAKVAPDTLTSSEILADRYFAMTGRLTTSEAVRELRGGISDEQLEAVGQHWDRFAKRLTVRSLGRASNQDQFPRPRPAEGASDGQE